MFTGNCWNLTTKDHKADAKKEDNMLGETSSKKAPKVVFGSTNIRYRDSEKARKEPRKTQKESKEVSTVPKTPSCYSEKWLFLHRTD